MIVRNYHQVEPDEFVEAPGVTLRWMIGEEEGAPNFALRVIDVEPGAASPFHTHAWEHEVFILAGEGHLRAVDGETPFGEGDAVFVPPEQKHQFVNDGETTLRFICVIPL